MPKKKTGTIKEQKEEFLKIYLKHLGITTIACKELGISYHTYQNWFKTDEKFRRSCLEVEQIQGDFVENKLLDKINEGDPTCIIFYLKAKRGWRDRQVLQIEGNIDHNIKQVQIIVQSNETKNLMEQSLKFLSDGKEIE